MFLKKLTNYEPTRRFTVNRDGFHGSYYKPETEHFPGKVMVIFGGSVGSFTLTEMTAEKFYEAGMNVLAVAYRDVEGTPSTLSGIPVELIANAARWCRENVAGKVGLWGISLGGQLALLAGSLYNDLISCVVAVNPMNFQQQGMKSFKKMEFEDCSCFTYQGKDLPYYPIGKYGDAFRKQIKTDAKKHHEWMYLRDFYETAVSQMPEDADYILHPEEIKGSVLLLSAGMDSLLPSELICQTIYQRLVKNQFTYPFEHHNYETVSHYLLPIKPLTAKMFRVERKQPAACDQSRSAAWKDTLSFLEKKW